MNLTKLYLQESKQTKKHVGVFIQLPENLAKKFPPLSEDDSAPHVTVLYLGEQQPNKEKDIVAAVKEAAEIIEPFELELGDMSHFHPDGEDYDRVAIMRVKSDGLRRLRTTLEHVMKDHKIKWTDKWGVYKPHVTLAYLWPGTEYTNGPISGVWTCDNIRVWGFDRKHTIKLKPKD